MSVRKTLLFLALASALLIAVSCDLLFPADPNDPDVTGTALSADITSATTLAAGVYTVTGSFYVRAALTISPGTTIKFASGTWIDVEASGQIIANGTSDKRIVFMSNAIAPAAGAWSEIEVNGSGSSFKYCDFKFATTALDLNAANTTVDYCVFTSNTTGIDATGVGAGFVVTNNAFTSNGEPLMINALNDLGATNSFTTNTKQRVFFYGDDVVAGATRTWSETEVPMYIDDSFYVYGTLVIAPGMTLSFDSGEWIDVTSTGKITAEGTATSRITFTSAAASPAASAWSEVEVNGSGSSFKYCDFKFAETALDLNAANTTVDNCAFTSNTTGIDATGVGAGFVVTNNAFTSNGEPLMINALNDLGATNSFTTNTKQRVFFYGDDVVAGATRTWSETEVPMYIDDSFYVYGTLVIAPGMTLSFDSGKWIDVTSTGKITADGTSASRITFTSAAASPAAGAWDEIEVSGDGSSFSYCDFLYATIPIDDQATNTVISNCVATFCANPLP